MRPTAPTALALLFSEFVRAVCVTCMVYGIYFGVLTRDAAEVCTQRISTALGIAKKFEGESEMVSRSKTRTPLRLHPFYHRQIRADRKPLFEWSQFPICYHTHLCTRDNFTPLRRSGSGRMSARCAAMTCSHPRPWPWHTPLNSTIITTTMAERGALANGRSMSHSSRSNVATPSMNRAYGAGRSWVSRISARTASSRWI